MDNIKNQERNTGLDLFKILCMFFVIWFHYSDHGNIQLKPDDHITFNWCILAVSRIFGGICNCAFVLTTGYFLFEKKFNLEKIIKLYLQVWFYSVFCGVISYSIKTDVITIESIIKMLFPLTFNQYWYFSTYIILIIFSPYLNILINSIDKKQHILLIIMCGLFFSVLPTFKLFLWLGVKNIEIFVFLYIAGSYLKKYGVNVSKLTFGILGIFGVFIEVISIFCVKFFLKADDMFYFVWGMEKMPCIFTSLALFMYFSKIRIKENRLFNFIMVSLFGVYLFHIGRLHTMWFQIIFDNSETYNTNLMIIQIIVCSMTIFISSILIDKIRIICFETPIMEFIDKIKKQHVAKRLKQIA